MKSGVCTSETLITAALSQLVNECPLDTAIVFHHLDHQEKLTYCELDKQSTALAHYLQTTHPEKKRLGLCLTRTPKMIVAMFAAFKAGMSIIPMETYADPILTHKSQIAEVILVDDQTKNMLQSEKAINLSAISLDVAVESFVPTALTAEDEAYIIYTSGTTSGKPKAVVLPHAALTNQLVGLSNQKYPLKRNVLCTAPFPFDAWIWDLLVALITKGEVHLCSESLRYDPVFLAKMCHDAGINFAALLPSIIDTLDPNEFKTITHLITMGAAAHARTLLAWNRINPACKIYNAFGQTETGISLSVDHVFSGEDDDPMLVGTPLANMQVHILNPETHQPFQQLGESGEVYVSGPGLAIGYLDNAELNKIRFPIINGTRMYASGDLGSLEQTKNGIELKILGRTDNRIKRRGVGIDLDELEQCLRQSPYIDDVAVLYDEAYDRITAYIVTRYTDVPGVEVDWYDVSDAVYCANKLPGITRINQYKSVSHLPLTVNAKVDKRAVLAMPATDFVRPNIMVRPQTSALQNIILDCWSEILGLIPNQIGINDSYAKLGGRSIDAIRLAEKLCAKVKNLFIKPHELILKLSYDMTVESLSQTLSPLIKIILLPVAGSASTSGQFAVRRPLVVVCAEPHVAKPSSSTGS